MKKINIAKLLKNISIVVSILISPLIVAPFTAGIFLYCNPQNAQQHILFTYILSFTCIIPFFTLLFYKYTNRISSFDVPEIENRIRLLVFASIYNTIGFLIINYLNTDIQRSHSDTFKIIFVGSVTDRKNPKIIIESLETIDGDVSLEIIGQTPNLKYLKELNNLISSSKYSERITMTPFIKAEELISKYASANLFILPSKSEGLGRVIIEAQATACPVLVSSNTGMVDLIIENETGYIFENNNKNDLSNKIQYIMNNYESALQTGLNSKNFIKENQSVANFEFGYKKLIDLVSI